MDVQMEQIKQYLKDHLSININEEYFGFNGKCVTIELRLDDEIISDSSYTIKEDEG